MPTVEEHTLDVLSVLDAQDNPVLANCSFSVGELVLEFKNGRAKCPESAAPSVARCPQITIPGYDGPIAPKPPNTSAPLPDEKEHEDSIALAREHLREEGMEVPDTQRVWVGETALDLPVAQAEALLRAGQATASQLQGGKVELTTKAVKLATVEGAAKAPTLPDGFSPLTEDGQPRCQARKGDGKQCSNAVVEGHACGLGAHKTQLE